MQEHTNLIARRRSRTVWTRHVADSLQLLALAPGASTWIDLGSGAGFPGLVIACALADTVRRASAPGRKQTEKSELPARMRARRSAFRPLCTRSESRILRGRNKRTFDVVTARALAPLDKLLSYANPLLKRGGIGLFPKGQDVEAELTAASKSWTIEADLVPSKTDPHGRIVRCAPCR